MRQPQRTIEPRPALAVGDKVKCAADKREWTVRAVTTGGRFAILTKPFNPQRTVLYSVIDFDWGIRGKDNHYGLGYEDSESIAAALHKFQHTESNNPPEVTNECEYDGAWCMGGAEVSPRSNNHIRLDFQRINGAEVAWDGNPPQPDATPDPVGETSESEPEESGA